MENVTIEQIEERLRGLPPQKWAVVLDFISYLVERQADSAYDAMFASEQVLRKDWDKIAEEEAWANL